MNDFNEGTTEEVYFDATFKQFLEKENGMRIWNIGFAIIVLSIHQKYTTYNI